MAENFVLVITGRGVLYTALVAANSLEELANRCQLSVDQGFEVYIYSLAPSPSKASVVHFPEGSTILKREYHLYDAREEFDIHTSNIINDLAAHSLEAGEKYLAASIEKLQKEHLQVQADLKRLEEPIGETDATKTPTEIPN